MVLKWNNIVSLILVFYLLQGQAFGQDSVPLKQLLEELELKHNVAFTYLEETIESIYIPSGMFGDNLEELLLKLEKYTRLDFEIIDDRYISINPGTSRLNKFCGHLLDRQSLQPVVGALVNFGSSFQVSDDDGYFEVELELDQLPVQITHLGFSDTTYNLIPNPGCANILLTPSVNKLPEVIVSGYIVNGINKTVSDNIVINMEDREILPGLIEPDVLHTLQILPGIQSTNETVSDINIRGGSNDQNMILLNDARLYQTGHFFGLISSVNPYITKDATLIKNGTPSAHGEAVSGSIVVNSLPGNVEKASGEAGINMLYGDAKVILPLGNQTNLMLAGRHSVPQGIATPTYNKFFDRAFTESTIIENLESDKTFGFYDFTANLTHRSSSGKQQLNVSFTQIQNSLEIEEQANIDGTQENRLSQLDQKNLLGSVGFSNQWTEEFGSKLITTISKYDLELDNIDLVNNQLLIQENEVLDLGAKLINTIVPNNSTDMVVGYQFNEIGILNARNVNKPEFESLGKNVLRNHALFYEFNHSFKSHTFLQLGVRGNYFESLDKVRIEPRLSATHQLGDFTISAKGELKSQTTTQVIDFQTDFLGVEKRRWIVVNGDDVPLIKSEQVSLGLTYSKPQVLLNAEGYYKTVNDLITSSQGFQNQFEFIRSVGGYQSVGFEVLCNPKVNRFNSWVTYTYMDNIYEFPELIPPSFRNNFDIKHNFSLGTAWEIAGLEISAGANYRTGKPFTEAMGVTPENGISYGAPNVLSLSNYLRLDLSMNYSFAIGKSGKGYIGASVLNLTNRKNYFNTYYRVVNSSLERVEHQGLGITPNLNLRVNF